MASCDCCGRSVDDRSLIRVGNYYVCPSCNGYYPETELVEKIEEQMVGGGKVEL
jgi:hypothetical protein